MAAPSTNNATADNAAVTANAPLPAASTAATAAAATVSAAAAAASNVWPNTRDSYELREVIGNILVVRHAPYTPARTARRALDGVFAM